MIVQSIIMIAIGLLIAGAGTLIRERGMLHLLAGFDESRVRDRDGLRRFAGTGVIILGLILVGGGALAALLARWDYVAVAVVAGTWLIFVIATFRLVLGTRTFSK